MSTLQVALVQTKLFWEDKEANLRMLEHKIHELPAGTHVAVLPEMFSTGFSMKPEALAETMEGLTVAWMRRLAANCKIIVAGSLIVEDDGKYFNRLVWMLPNGQCGHYDKRHLFAYGHEDRHYSGGAQRLIASVNGWKVNLMVCYDLRFPVWARQQPAEGQPFEYDLLVYVANWPERRSTAWKTLLQARAIENQCYVIGVNRVGADGNDVYHSGDSMAIDPLGAVLYHKAHEEDVAVVPLDKAHLEEARRQFPFWKDADAFSIAP